MSRRRGYILPMTLALVAIAALVLARVCREDLRQSLRADDDTKELQRRWGLLSCQVTYLRRAEGVLESTEKAAGQATASANAVVQLGGTSFDLSFADESAKLSVNALYQRSELTSVERAVRSATRQSSGRLVVRLRPIIRDAGHSADQDAAPAFASFGQIYDESASPSANPIKSATRELTCWGDGKLNWRRASASALAEILHGDRQSAARIVSLQKRGAAASVQDFRAALAAAPDARKAANDLFTDSSNAQSLWITCGNSESPAARFAVRWARDDGRASIMSFAWQP